MGIDSCGSIIPLGIVVSNRFYEEYLFNPVESLRYVSLHKPCGIILQEYFVENAEEIRKWYRVLLDLLDNLGIGGSVFHVSRHVPLPIIPLNSRYVYVTNPVKPVYLKNTVMKAVSRSIENLLSFIDYRRFGVFRHVYAPVNGVSPILSHTSPIELYKSTNSFDQLLDVVLSGLSTEPIVDFVDNIGRVYLFHESDGVIYGASITYFPPRKRYLHLRIFIGYRKPDKTIEQVFGETHRIPYTSTPSTITTILNNRFETIRKKLTKYTSIINAVKESINKLQEASSPLFDEIIDIYPETLSSSTLFVNIRDIDININDIPFARTTPYGSTIIEYPITINTDPEKMLNDIDKLIIRIEERLQRKTIIDGIVVE